MVIHLDNPRSFRRTLRYNERKVERGHARCIYAGNFILDAHQLTISDKLDRFWSLDRLRPDHLQNFIHASLNFHPSDKPDKEKMILVAADYMRDLGFAGQPWLLYEHTDTKIPHVHLVASRVTNDGRILSAYTEYNRLVTNLRQLEIDHGLVQSRRREKNPQLTLSSAKPVRPEYGKGLTRDAIASALAHVLPNYNYSNLTELNAILRQYGVWADDGKPGGTLAAIRGVSYQLLDQEGRGIGKRVGASVIGFNPGLDYLEAQFQANARRASSDLSPLSVRVQLARLRAPGDWQRFAADLRAAGIDTVPFMSAKGQVYDVVFIDHSRKLVASAHRLDGVATLKHLQAPPPPGLAYQRLLVKDMNRARRELPLQPPAEDSRTLHLRQEKQHKISR